MPRLKQPESLQKMSLDVIHEFILRCCDRLSVEGKLDELRRVISTIKHQCWNCLPWSLLAEFANRFIDKFESAERPDSHNAAALEILMDVEIVGLSCRGRIVKHLRPEDTRRLRTLAELDLEYSSDNLRNNFRNFRLDGLTTLIFPRYCDNRHLKIIGQNCSNLQILKVPNSRVTGNGLTALNDCSQLRVLDIFDCEVSTDALNKFLSANKNIEDLSHWDSNFNYERSQKNVSILDSTVYPSMINFHCKNDRYGKLLNVQTIAVKFPNLSYLTIDCSVAENLAVLKSLTKLTGLEIKFEEDMFYSDIEEMWESIKELLTFVGSNVTTLKFRCFDRGFFWSQTRIDFIQEWCPNLEVFGFDQGNGVVVVPTFPKLKELIPRIPIEFEQIEILYDPGLEFDALPSLETLSILNYGMNFDAIKSIMLDNVKFPKLSVIETNCLKDDELERLEMIARNNNLDLKIKYDSESNWYIEYRFGEGSNSDDD